MYTNIEFEPGFEKTYNFNVYNDGQTQATLNIKGSLEEYITLDQKEIVFETKQPVSFKILLPRDMVPGNYNTNIEVSQTNIELGMIQVVPTVAHKISLFVPAHGKYIKEAVTINQKNINFWIKNIGVKEISDIEIYNKIYGMGYNKTFIEDNTNFQADQIINFSIQKQVPPGRYYLETMIFYDELKKNITQEFLQGDIEINIKNPLFKDFKTDEINEIVIPLESNWNEELTNMYVVLEITKGEKIIFNRKSSDFAMNKTIPISMFWDLNEFKEGDYNYKISVYMNEELLKEQVFKEIVKNKTNKNSLLIIIIAICTLLIAISIWKFKVKNLKKKK